MISPVGVTSCLLEQPHHRLFAACLTKHEIKIPFHCHVLTRICVFQPLFRIMSISILYIHQWDRNLLLFWPKMWPRVLDALIPLPVAAAPRRPLSLMPPSHRQRCRGVGAPVFAKGHKSHTYIGYQVQTSVGLETQDADQPPSTKLMSFAPFRHHHPMNYADIQCVI